MALFSSQAIRAIPQKKLQVVIERWFEPFLFLFLIGYSLVTVWVPEAYLSFDGASHLHNARLLFNFSESELFQRFYERTPFYLPNYFSHIVLGLLMKYFPPLIAEKLFVSLIVVLLPLSFRSLARVISGKPVLLSLFVFFLLFGKLTHMGFYNFIMAFVFFNVALLLYYRQSRKGMEAWNVVCSILNAILLYYTHALVFSLACIVLLILSLSEGKAGLLKRLEKCAYLLYFLPGIVMYFFFITNISIPNYNYDFSPYQKVISLITFEAGLSFNTHQELPNTSLVSIVLLFTIGFVLAGREGNTLVSRLRISDLFLLFAFGFIYFIFHSKDGDFGGMFGQRLAFMAYYFAILWVLCNVSFQWTHYLVATIIGLVAFFSIAATRLKEFKVSDPIAKSVMKCSAFIPEKSVVHTICFSDIWYTMHFSAYLGLNKDLLLLDNYEAILNWFPLKWIKDPAETNTTILNDLPGKSVVDYIFIFGSERRLKEEAYKNQRNFILKRTVPIYHSADSLCHLYAVKPMLADTNAKN